MENNENIEYKQKLEAKQNDPTLSEEQRKFIANIIKEESTDRKADWKYTYEY